MPFGVLKVQKQCGYLTICLALYESCYTMYMVYNGGGLDSNWLLYQCSGIGRCFDKRGLHLTIPYNSFTLQDISSVRRTHAEGI